MTNPLVAVPDSMQKHTVKRARVLARRPKQLFVDWLHSADPTSHEITLLDVCQEPTIYLIPEGDSDEELAAVLRELCQEIFEEQLGGWYKDTSSWPQDRS